MPRCLFFSFFCYGWRFSFTALHIIVFFVVYMYNSPVREWCFSGRLSDTTYTHKESERDMPGIGGGRDESEQQPCWCDNILLIMYPAISPAVGGAYRVSVWLYVCYVCLVRQNANKIMFKYAMYAKWRPAALCASRTQHISVQCNFTSFGAAGLLVVVCICAKMTKVGIHYQLNVDTFMRIFA